MVPLSRPRLVLLLLTLGALLFAAGWLVRSDREAAAPADGAEALASLRAEVRELRESVAAERAGRLALADELAALREEVLAAAGPDGGAEGPDAGGLVDAVVAGPDPNGDAPADGAAPAARGPGRPFDEAAMLAAGFAPDVVEQMRARMDEFDLERLYLRDQATREGWAGTLRFLKEVQDLDQELLSTRDEFGPEALDWMLYTSGRPNRVAVMEVIEGSPAAYAGFQRGDVIVGYGDRRIFDVEELRRETVRGNAGETTPVEVLRDGSREVLSVPRGPIGIRMYNTAVRPPPPR